MRVNVWQYLRHDGTEFNKNECRWYRKDTEEAGREPNSGPA